MFCFNYFDTTGAGDYYHCYYDDVYQGILRCDSAELGFSIFLAPDATKLPIEIRFAFLSTLIKKPLEVA